MLLYLIFWYKLEQKENIMKVLLPFHLNKVGAGFPSPATDYIEDDVDLNSHLIKIYLQLFLLGYRENL